jgi:hypothetical protein
VHKSTINHYYCILSQAHIIASELFITGLTAILLNISSTIPDKSLVGTYQRSSQSICIVRGYLPFKPKFQNTEQTLLILNHY